MITQLKFVGIPTRDQDRALKFYTEQLGFEVSTDQVFDDTQRWIELRVANSPTRVVLFTPDGHENRIGTFFNGAFACDDVPATYRQLKSRGVVFSSEPQKQPWGEFATSRIPTAISSCCPLLEQQYPPCQLLWFAYPKSTSKRYTCEFNRDQGWEALRASGFDSVRQVAIDEDWSALRFRRIEFINHRSR